MKKERLKKRKILAPLFLHSLGICCSVKRRKILHPLFFAQSGDLLLYCVVQIYCACAKTAVFFLSNKKIFIEVKISYSIKIRE
jgi:hypothetical protein